MTLLQSDFLNRFIEENEPTEKTEKYFSVRRMEQMMQNEEHENWNKKKRRESTVVWRSQARGSRIFIMIENEEHKLRPERKFEMIIDMWPSLVSKYLIPFWSKYRLYDWIQCQIWDG